MPINIISRKFYNQLRNGKTFTSNPSDITNFLQGTICEKIRTETTIDVYWKSINTPYVDIFSISTSGSDRHFSRQMNSFVTDGFNIGDTFFYDIWDTLGTHYTGTGTILTVSDLLIVTNGALAPVIGGALPDTSSITISSITIWGTTSLAAIIFKYNLIENSAADTFISLIDGNTQSYAGSGLTGTDTTLTAQGSLLSWKDEGTVKVKTGTSGVTGYQRFIITHDFWVTPFYLPSQYSDLQLSIPPSYLKDICSLKYIANYELRQSLYNPNISHGGVDSQMLGDVSWFDEHFNGFIPIEFTKESIAYSVSGTAVTELQPNDITHVIIEINSVNNLFLTANTNFIVNLFKLPINESEYKNTLTDMFENFVFEQCFQTIGSGAVSGEYSTWFPTQPPIITNCIGSILTNRLHIEFDVTFTAAQKLLIADRQYIISVITDDHTQAHATSKEVNVLCDYNSFLSTLDNPLLLTLDSCKFWEHPFDPTVTGTGNKNFRGWITDGIYNETQFTLSAGATLNYFKFKVRAYNSVTLESFDLMLQEFDLSSYPIIGGERVISINTTRGFKLITASIRNLVYLKNTGTLNQYLLKYAFKLRWEDWIQLITANTDFYDSTKINNNLNQKWSNYYDTVTNWELEILQIATVEDPLTGTSTDFNIISELDCHNFAEDGNTPPLWTVALETFEGAVSLGTNSNAKYSLTQDTKIVATFTSVNALATSDIYGLIYIEQYQQGGIFNQWQLSSEELPAVNNWLKPITGQTKAKVTILDANHVKVEVMIDFTKVNGNISIAARIGYACINITEIRAWQTVVVRNTERIFEDCRSFDLTINGTVIETGHAIPSPYTISEVLNEFKAVSGGYDFTTTPPDTSTCIAPVGTGSSANGDVLIFTLYANSSKGSPLLGTWTYTLSGGVDELVCSNVLIPTNKRLLETGNYKKLETGVFRNLEY